MFVLRPCCTFRGLSFLAAMLVATARAAQDRVEWTEMYVPYRSDADADLYGASFSGTPPYTEDTPLRHHLHVYRSPSDKPTPVFFFAHSAGNTADRVRQSGGWFDLVRSGYSVISWETITATTMEDGQNCIDDFDLVWLWFKANAKSYNFDTESVIIGGRSQGSNCSWELANSGKPEIKGIYMINAFPDPSWVPEAEMGSGYIWDQVVTTNSPPTHLLYLSECPKPIQQDCVPSPKPDDWHNPRHGQTIVDRYNELGIGSRIQLTDGLDNKQMKPFDLFSDFVASLSSNEAAEAEAEVEVEDFPGIKFFFDVTIIAFFGFWAAFGYHKYYMMKQSYPNRKEYNRVQLKSEVSMQDMSESSHQDETDKTDGFPNDVNW